MKPFGRKRPYRVAELITRAILCSGCGKRPAVHQWSCCANDHRQMPVCLDCDFALNEMALAFFRVPGRDKLMAAYKKRELRQEPIERKRWMGWIKEQQREHRKRHKLGGGAVPSRKPAGRKRRPARDR